MQAINITHITAGEALSNALTEVTGQKTVPNIFIGNQHIGGYSQLHSLIKEENSEFQVLLQRADNRQQSGESNHLYVNGNKL